MSPVEISPDSNPLRISTDRRLNRIAGPSGLIIFGVTGDLARKKLMPAVYDLANRGLLPPGFALVGFARRDWEHQDFEKVVYDAVKKYARTPFDDDVWKQLAQGIRFVQGEFDDDDAFARLKATVEDLDENRGTMGNHAFYLSIPPKSFPQVTEQLRRSGLAEQKDGQWRRVVIEKPFGSDLTSARQLNEVVESVFPPDSVFRIDHYLGKETVQNILVFRFRNAMFEPLWNQKYVELVQITVAENIGMEGGRGGYYDTSGAIRDILQNHVLQLLAMVAMEAPSKLDPKSIRDEKVKVLHAIQPPAPDRTIRAQYAPGTISGTEVPGYLGESGVPAESNTETFAAVRLNVQNWRWAGVPFYLRTGKRLSRKVTEIAVTLRPVPHQAFNQEGAVGVQPNQLIFTVQPNEGVTLKLGAKIPGTRMRVRGVNMEFLYGTTFLSQSPEAYEKLIMDAMRGDATLFTRNDEVEAQWRIMDPVVQRWENEPGPLPQYDAGSPGPAEADSILAGDDEWRAI